MVICAVGKCRNNSRNCKGTGVSFFTFPTRDNKLCKLWVIKCQRVDKINISHDRVCSAHFKESDYERDLQNELLGLPLRKILKKTAVPSISPLLNDENDSRKLRFETRQRKILVENILKDSYLSNDNKRQDILPGTEPILPITFMPKRGINANIIHEKDTEPTLPTTFISQTRINRNVELQKDTEPVLPIYFTSQTTMNTNVVHDKECEIMELKEKLQQQRILIEQQHQNIIQQQAVIKQQKERILHQNFLNTRNQDKVSTDNSKLEASFFSPAQIKKLRGKRKIRWKSEDIVKALSLRCVSLKAYDVALTQLKLPLPPIRTLRHWARKFDCSEGILSDVIEILKEKASTMDNLSRLAVIAFDEMTVDSSYVMDPTFGKVYNNSKAQVLMLRGLCSDWKQVIYYNFDTDVTKELLSKIIIKLEECGFLIYAIVCDLGTENRSLIKSLNINENNVRFMNPSDSTRHVYVFPDVPHCLKNIRNHVLDDGVILEDGTIIDKSTLLFMAQNNGDELKLCPSLTAQSLEIKGAERMRVRPAAQLLSHRVSTLADRVFPDNLSIANFFETINNGFDVLNSRVPVDKRNNLKSGFGFHDDQVSALIHLKYLLSTVKFRTKHGNEKKKMLPCQLGFIISIKALCQLYSDLKQRYDVHYILTSHLNQDCVESFFSVIRFFGGPNSQPTPPEFRFRLRLIILGGRTRPPRGSNVEEINIQYLSSELLKNNKLNNYSISDEDMMTFREELEEEELEINMEVVQIKFLSYLKNNLKI